MKVKTNERHQARLLRRQGLSFREIQSIVGVPKSTLNLWLKDIELTDEQKQRLQDRAVTGREKARMRGAWQNREKRRQRIAAAFEKARSEFPQKIRDPLFTTGVVLYWAEGTKGKANPRFEFTNSDPIAIRTMKRGNRPCSLAVPGALFQTHPAQDQEEPSYMGCCRIVVNSSDLFWRLRTWQEELVRYLGISLPSHLIEWSDTWTH